jgi:hypothetical protein
MRTRCDRFRNFASTPARSADRCGNGPDGARDRLIASPERHPAPLAAAIDKLLRPGCDVVRRLERPGRRGPILGDHRPQQTPPEHVNAVAEPGQQPPRLTVRPGVILLHDRPNPPAGQRVVGPSQDVRLVSFDIQFRDTNFSAPENVVQSGDFDQVSRPQGPRRCGPTVIHLRPGRGFEHGLAVVITQREVEHPAGAKRGVPAN